MRPHSRISSAGCSKPRSLVTVRAQSMHFQTLSALRPPAAGDRIFAYPSGLGGCKLKAVGAVFSNLNI